MRVGLLNEKHQKCLLKHIIVPSVISKIAFCGDLPLELEVTSFRYEAKAEERGRAATTDHFAPL